MGSGTDKRKRADAVRAAKMKREGYSITAIAEALGINREKVNDRVRLGERLLTLDDPIRAHEPAP
jgi:transposase-like protein